MSDPFRPLSSENPPAPLGPTRKRRVALIVVTAALVISAILIVVLPINLPFPIKLAVAAGDLFAAVIVAMVLRQSRT